MNTWIKWFRTFFKTHFWSSDPSFDPHQILLCLLMALAWIAVTFAILYSSLHSHPAFASSNGSLMNLPGSDMSQSLQAAGILLKTLDTGIFKWGARVFAGLCIMSSAWALKEQRFGIAIICVIGAIIFGTAPRWVADIFSIGGNGGIFSEYQPAVFPKNSMNLAKAKGIGVPDHA